MKGSSSVSELFRKLREGEVKMKVRDAVYFPYE